MNNPPAFPSKQKALMIKSEHIGIASEYEIEHNGMTLQDYFAAKAMQSLLSRLDIDEVPTTGSNQFTSICLISYFVATEMMIAREA